MTMPGHRLAIALAVLVCAGPALARTSSDLMRDLTVKSTVTRGDCMDAAAALVAGAAAPTDPGAVMRLLRQHRVLRGSEADQPVRAATRGFACLLFARALDERGGVMRHLLPSSEHYAYRHLEFLGLIPAGGSGRPVTGLELVSLLSLSRKRLAGRDSGEAAR